MQMIIDVDEKLVCEGFERPFTEEEKATLIRAIGNGRSYNPSGDAISREYVKAKMFDIPKPKEGATFWDGVDTVGNLIDNAPAVEPFTQLEKEEIASAIKYLLGAELLEENGYTEEVKNALRSALRKVGGKEE